MLTTKYVGLKKSHTFVRVTIVIIMMMIIFGMTEIMTIIMLRYRTDQDDEGGYSDDCECNDGSS